MPQTPETNRQRRPATRPAPKSEGNKPRRAPNALSPEEKRRREEVLRTLKAEEQARRQAAAAQRKTRRIRLFRLSGIFSVVLVLIYWLAVALMIRGRDDGSENAVPVKIFTEASRKEDKTFKVDDVYFNGTYYLPVTFLKDYTAISEFGDHKTRSFSLAATGEYASFDLGTGNAVVNGQTVSIKAVSFVKNDTLYLPVDFYTDKMSCFEFAYSSALSANVLTYLESAGMGFTFHESRESARVDVSTAPLPAPVEPEATV